MKQKISMVAFGLKKLEQEGSKRMSNKSKKKTKKQNKKNKEPLKFSKKQRFDKQTNETVEDVLARMKKAGYTPVRRFEKPIFKEIIKNGEKKLVPDDQQIIFDGILNKDEH